MASSVFTTHFQDGTRQEKEFSDNYYVMWYTSLLPVQEWLSAYGIKQKHVTDLFRKQDEVDKLLDAVAHGDQ